MLNFLGFWSETSLISLEISEVEFVCKGEEKEVQMEGDMLNSLLLVLLSLANYE